jgi:hypothetical protein
MISYDILISQISFFLVDLEEISQSVQLSANQTIDSPGTSSKARSSIHF